MRIEPKKLKTFLLDADLVKEKHLKGAEKKAKKLHKPLEEILVSEGLITEDDLMRLKAYVSGVPFINLDKAVVDQEVLDIIPEAIANSYNIVPFK